MKIVKNLIYVSLLTITSCQSTPETFDIHGTIDNLEDGEALLISYNGELQKMDTLAQAPVKEGKFYMSGSVAEPLTATLMVDDSYNEFILENGEFTAILKKLGEGEIQGGVINTIVNGYKQRLDYQDALTKMKEAREESLSVGGKAESDLQDSYAKIGIIVSQYQDSILASDVSAWAKAFTLSQVQNWEKYDITKRNRMLDTYVQEIGESSYIKGLKNSFKAMDDELKMRKSVANGQPYKEVIANSKEGVEIKLSDIVKMNKYTLLEFWSSWCKPCRAEIPNLKTAYAKYHKKGFEIYALSLDENEGHWLNAMRDEGTPWLNIVDLRNFGSPAAKDYAVTGIPASFLISSDGTIVASGDEVRGEGLDHILESLMK